MHSLGFIPAEYGKLLSRPLSRSFWFLVVICLVIAALITSLAFVGQIKMVKLLIVWVEENLTQLSGEMPAIEVASGKLVQPERTYVRQFGDMLFAIEPETGKAQEMLEVNEQALVISRTTVWFKQKGEDIRGYGLEGIEYLSITPEDNGLLFEWKNGRTFKLTGEKAARFIKTFSILLVPVIFIALFVYHLLAKLLLLFAYSPASLLFNRLLARRLTYAQLLTIGIYALVPAVTCAVIQAFFNLPLRVPVFAAVYLAYLYMGIREGGRSLPAPRDTPPDSSRIPGPTGPETPGNTGLRF